MTRTRLTAAEEEELAEGRRVAHLGLWVAILEAQDAGAKVPCLGSGELDPIAWISDKPAEQEKAAEACGTCPVLGSCRAYVEQHKEPGGTWAGLTSKQRRGQR